MNESLEPFIIPHPKVNVVFPYVDTERPNGDPLLDPVNKKGIESWQSSLDYPGRHRGLYSVVEVGQNPNQTYWLFKPKETWENYVAMYIKNYPATNAIGNKSIFEVREQDRQINDWYVWAVNLLTQQIAAQAASYDFDFTARAFGSPGFANATQRKIITQEPYMNFVSDLDISLIVTNEQSLQTVVRGLSIFGTNVATNFYKLIENQKRLPFPHFDIFISTLEANQGITLCQVDNPFFAGDLEKYRGAQNIR